MERDYRQGEFDDYCWMRPHGPVATGETRVWVDGEELHIAIKAAGLDHFVPRSGCAKVSVEFHP